MVNFQNILNQREAAEYITKNGIRMTAPMLSELTKMGLGPAFEPKGNQKLFLRSDVDDWISQQRKQSDRGDEAERPAS